MPIFSKLFGGGRTSEPEAPEFIEYDGFRITPDPMKEGTKFRLSAVIEKDIGGETKSHKLIRADLLDSWDDAAEAAARKAKQVIDEQGDRVFR